MRELFFNIASAITEWTTGLDGTGHGIEGMVEVFEYIRVLEQVKSLLNILTVTTIVMFIISTVAICKFLHKKLSKRFCNEG